MNLLRLLLLKARRRPTLTQTPDSVATPLGHVPYKRSFVVKEQPWIPSVSARNAQWPDEKREADE